MLIDKNLLPLVAMDTMNKVHLEDVDIINSLSKLIDECDKVQTDQIVLKIDECYQHWYKHTQEHFKSEETMMIEKGFFAYDMHKMEHESTLLRMKEISVSWHDQRDIKILKNYIQNELLQWLVNHIQTMDTVTAIFLKTGRSPCHDFDF